MELYQGSKGIRQWTLKLSILHKLKIMIEKDKPHNQDLIFVFLLIGMMILLAKITFLKKLNVLPIVGKVRLSKYFKSPTWKVSQRNTSISIKFYICNIIFKRKQNMYKNKRRTPTCFYCYIILYNLIIFSNKMCVLININ